MEPLPITGPYAGLAQNVGQQNRITELEEIVNRLGAQGQGGGYRGLAFDQGSEGGVLGRIMERYGNASTNVLQGSRQAEDLLRGAYDDLFTTRAEGIVGQRQSFDRSLENLARSQGYSQSLVDMLSEQAGFQTQGLLSEARSATQGDLGRYLAQLTKGTATEIAGLEQSAAQSLLEKDLGMVAADAARDAADKDLLGGIIGGVASAVPFF